jgi:membrane-associated phospholipid phosphatase
MKNIKKFKCLFLVICSVALNANLYSEDAPVPLSTIFHDIGENALHSFTYNYGLNFIGAGLGTWAFIGTGIDWQWNRLAYNNSVYINAGLPALYIGYLIPAVTPLTLYMTGRISQNAKLQITSMALTQSLMLTLGIQTVLKITTGRALPGLVNQLDQRRSARVNNFCDEFHWFNMNAIAGWPSGHTANAFAAAAAVAEIYKDNTPLKIAVYSYATLIGVGISLTAHWASDVLAGALIGFAIGKTVGRSFSHLLAAEHNENKLSFYITPDSVGVRRRF